jgi:hypothetical protein
MFKLTIPVQASLNEAERYSFIPKNRRAPYGPFIKGYLIFLQ